MRTLQKVLFFTCVGIGLCNCSQNESVFDESSRPMTTLSIGHEQFVENNNSRTVIDNQLTEGVLVMNWEVKDKVGVFTESTNNECFTNTNKVPSQESSFTGYLPKGQNLKYAYYPYNNRASDKKAIPVYLPVQQNYSNLNSIARYDIKASKRIEKLSDQSFDLKMQQMVTLLHFDINITDLSNLMKQTLGSLPANERLIKVVLNSDSDLTGNYTYDLTNLPQGLKGIANSTSKSLSITFSQLPLLTEDKASAYALVAPGKQNGVSLIFDIYTDHYIVKCVTSGLCDFEAGTFYQISLKKSVFENPQNSVTVQTIVEQPSYPHPEYSEETANCYMISTTGQHSFWGTQIGNGIKGIIHGVGFHTENPYIQPTSAKLLWQDVENFVSDVTFNPEDGHVHYIANKNVGNALIAVSDEKGTILWSWHIWGVGNEIPLSEEYTNFAGGKFLVMDRNLGAHSKESKDATLYQWGRKDPVPSSLNYYIGNQNVSTTIDKSYPVKAIENPSLIFAIQNPEAMIGNTALAYNADWVYPTNFYLWGDNNNEDFDSLPLDPVNGKPLKHMTAGAGWTHQKTIYDPSPVGYRVANKYTFTGFLNPETTITNVINSAINDVNLDKEQGIWYLCKNNDDVTGAVYPLSGSRGAVDGSLYAGNTLERGHSASIWTSGYKESTNPNNPIYQSHYLSLSFKTGLHAQRSLDVMAFLNRGVACSVRCVEE